MVNSNNKEMSEVEPFCSASALSDVNITSFQIEEAFDTLQAVNEAKRCLRCKNPQCVKGCPIGNNIPEFIHQVSKGNFGNATEIIYETSTLPAVCGRVCPHEKQCQGNCILGKKGNPIQIGKLESFVADYDTKLEFIREYIPQKSRGKIAVIGSGPAGLTVAGKLARSGFSVTIYESQQEAGGVLLYGIPAYRLPKTVVRQEIEKIRALGVEFRLNSTVGVDMLTVDSIFDEGFDAIFIGTGTAIPKTVKTPGIDLYGVHQAISLLHQVTAFNDGSISKHHVPLREGEHVAIMGCGNVAIDAARTAIRFGTDVTIVSIEGKDAMPASEKEYKEALSEGVKFLWNTEIVKFIGNDNKRLCSLELRHNDEIDTLEIDRVFLAIGSRPANRIVSTTNGIEVDSKGYVITYGNPYGMTTRKGVFAGGDVVHRPQTVVQAIKAAKDVADSIAQYVDAVKLLNLIEQLENKNEG